MLQRKYPLHGIIIALDRANVSFIARVPCKLPTVSICYNLKHENLQTRVNDYLSILAYIQGKKRGKNSLEISWTLVNVETSVRRIPSGGTSFSSPLSFVCQPWHREKKGRELRPSTSRSVKLSQYWSKHSRIIASLSCKPALPSRFGDRLYARFAFCIQKACRATWHLPAPLTTLSKYSQYLNTPP